MPSQYSNAKVMRCMTAAITRSSSGAWCVSIVRRKAIRSCSSEANTARSRDEKKKRRRFPGGVVRGGAIKPLPAKLTPQAHFVVKAIPVKTTGRSDRTVRCAERTATDILVLIDELEVDDLRRAVGNTEVEVIVFDRIRREDVRENLSRRVRANPFIPAKHAPLRIELIRREERIAVIPVFARARRDVHVVLRVEIFEARATFVGLVGRQNVETAGRLQFRIGHERGSDGFVVA